MSERVELVALRRLALVNAEVIAARTVANTVEAVVEGAAHLVSSTFVALSLRNEAGDFQIRAVARPARLDCSAEMVIAAEDMRHILVHAEAEGRLRIAAGGEAIDGRFARWSDDGSITGHGPLTPSDAWLLAPLYAASGEMDGVLLMSVADAKGRPGRPVAALIEAFATQAAGSIDNARLTEDLTAERERLRLEHSRLEASDTAFRFAFTSSPASMATVSLDPADRGRFLQVNDALCRLLGYEPAELLAFHWRDLVVADDHDLVDTAVEDFAAGRREDLRTERHVTRRDGTVIWVAVTATLVDADGLSTPFLLATAEDITERRRRETTLWRQATLDHLTGLPNRRLGLECLDAATERARAGKPGAVFYCDLDNFKQVNDTHGHVVGDRALQEAAQRLRAEVRDADIVARLGGDEFLIIAEDLLPHRSEQLADRIRRAMRQQLATIPIALPISVGVAVFDAISHDPALLLYQADQAMYADKRHNPE
ncbi:MAG: diguanylate cyclase [Actinomycetota bacterium]|nr:diguanylate cyclase [Actinomycetota bacterium]